METYEKTEKNTHHGHAIKRLRNTLGIKQEALAMDMGLSQQIISSYEQKKVIEDEMINRFARALDVSPALIRELEEASLTVIIENNRFENNSGMQLACEIENVVNNPIERIIELTNEKVVLYERMLKIEQEKVALLEDVLKGKL